MITLDNIPVVIVSDTEVRCDWKEYQLIGIWGVAFSVINIFWSIIMALSDKPISRPLICLLPQNDKYAAANCFSISRSNVSKMINNEQKFFIPNVKS